MDKEEEKYLAKISPTFNGTTYFITAPKLPPVQRLQRRLAFRNNIYVYKRPCSLTGKQIFSMFPEGTQFPVYENETWWSDSWDARDYGKDFDFNRGFFEQFLELRNLCPHRSISLHQCENSDFCNNATHLKNCYLVFNGAEVEDCLYCEKVPHSKDCIDCTECHSCELCFDCSGCASCYNLQSSLFCDNCQDSYFLQNCRSCKNCFGCVNLRHKQYCFLNKQLSKDEYFANLQKLKLGSYSGRKQIEEKCREFFASKPFPHTHQVFTENSTGSCLFECKNVFDSFFMSKAEDCRYGMGAYDGVKDCRDFSFFGLKAELVYESTQCGINVQNLSFCHDCWENNYNLLYCWMLAKSNDCFGCVSLKNARYCVFNKQYSKEEYEALVPKIIEHMKKTGEWGDFFPLQFSPHPYNRSVAQRYFPLDPNTAIKHELWWFEDEADSPIPSALSDELPPTDDPITAVSLASGRKFLITQKEIRLYRKFNVPLPRKCYDERMTERIHKLGNIHLVDRKCAKTGKTLQTSFNEQQAPVLWDKESYDAEFN